MISNLEPNRCPHCNRLHDKATSAEVGATKPVVPSPGDICMCVSCGELATFTEPLGLRLPTPYEVSKAYAECEGLAAARAYVKARGPAPEPS